MKTPEEIARIPLGELEAASTDGRIDVPEELPGKVGEALERAGKADARRFRWALPAAAVLAALVAVGLSVTRNPEPEDTFDDPYLAYAEVEKAFSKISGTVSYGAGKVAESEKTLDKINYWK